MPKRRLTKADFAAELRIRDRLALGEDEELCNEQVRRGMAEVQSGWSELERQRRMVVGHPERVETEVYSIVGLRLINKVMDMM